MANSSNRVLDRMLERLFASLINGPSLNCRPHNSRQRIDFIQLAKLQDKEPAGIMADLLSEKADVKVVAKVAPLSRKINENDQNRKEELTAEEKAQRIAWSEQETVLSKLRGIAEDGKVYEQDTGVHVLNIGFPVLSLPPGSFGSRGNMTRRITAPIAFIPVNVTLQQGAVKSLELDCKNDGADRIMPNIALFAWLERQTNQPQPELFEDEKGIDPWREIRELTEYAAKLTNIPVPDFVEYLHEPSGPDAKLSLELRASPRADSEDGATIVPAAVLGLFPVANQGLLRDTQALVDGETVTGPLESFISLNRLMNDEDELVAQTKPADVPPTDQPVAKRTRNFADERLITTADPCQSRAVRLSREAKGLVIHGPPGTGKSQTIANIIGDHLARGQRVLFVCDKRTALDVVLNRLTHFGIGDLCAVVHDPQRDQKELYKSIRQQLDDLPDRVIDTNAERQLTRLDSELQRLHGELTDYTSALSTKDPNMGTSFHDLVGQWLAISTPTDIRVNEEAACRVTVDQLDEHAQNIQDILERSSRICWPHNPWAEIAGISLEDYLSRSMDEHRGALNGFVQALNKADGCADDNIPPFDKNSPLLEEAEHRGELAQALVPWTDNHDRTVLSGWLGKDEQAIHHARSKIDEAGKNLQIFRSTQLSAELFAIIATNLPNRQKVADDWKLLNEYLTQYAKWAGLFERIKAKAPEASVEVITQWMGQDQKLIERARKKLADDAGLIEQVAGSAMDRQLRLQYERQPFDVRQTVEWLNLINDYLAAGAKWYAFLTPGPKNRAKPVLSFFGLPVTLAAATQVQEFLKQLRARLDLRSDLENGILKTPFATLPPDDELMAVVRAHQSVTSALAEAAADSEIKDEKGLTTSEDIVHPFMSRQVETAANVLQPYNLTPNLTSVRQVRTFLSALHARMMLTQIYQNALGGPITGALLADSELEHAFTGHADALNFLVWFREQHCLQYLAPALARALEDVSSLQQLVIGLQKSRDRAAAIDQALQAAKACKLFTPQWMEQLSADLRQGDRKSELATPLADHLQDIETVLRIRSGLAALPDGLREMIQGLMAQDTDPELGFPIVRKAVLAGEIKRRLRTNPTLQSVDAQRLKTCFERYQQLDGEKRMVARQLINARWTLGQRDRLLAMTGKRLNSLGADLRRRLMIRGQRAMRLRQVIKVGQETEGGDPLFDLRPVWMASPETVAQLFPRKALFDVVIFDEASQCRLEEALPVLTRAQRVVVAGDPKQLPPTRFFESATVVSEDEDITSDQQLFESQQADVEDLLGASLNLEIQECYLDVHYRSRNSDLIQFSNEQFYGSRLQAIPGHPSNITRYAPISLYHAKGIYEDRCNVIEAEKVCYIVRDLLRRAEPPSIGIACFNLQQRDLIVDKLDELALADREFAGRLAAARTRSGVGSFEGLFVKNLENVQGDERDHIIISTTYGPDPKGKFYKRFGPLGMPGGGRRLNVLVTRARAEVHIVTSIPREIYRSLPPIPSGQTPNGGWLLFSYLSYAEQLEEAYKALNQELDEAQVAQTPKINVRKTRYPSGLSESFGQHVMQRFHQGADIHWGNDGFCVDVAFHHPVRPDDVTIGVLCDMSRFAQAEDIVEWDVFRTMILETQGWQLHRIWSPHFFRDVDGGTHEIVQKIKEFLNADHDPDTIRTQTL